MYQKQQYLEAGKIVTTHGVRGEMKVYPYCDSPEFLLNFKTFYLDGKPVQPVEMRVHKSMLLLRLPGIDNVDSAMGLINKVLYFDRNDVSLPQGSHFICDLIGLEVFDERLGRVIGRITDVLQRPANDVYVVVGEGPETLIPAVKEFIVATDFETGRLTIRSIPGMIDGE